MPPAANCALAESADGQVDGRAMVLLPTVTTDADIVSRVRAGDARGAIALCARHYGSPVSRLCFAMFGTQSDAEEATQETFLAAYDGMDSFRGEGSVKSWLFGIARRVCARRIEVRARQVRRLALLRNEESTGVGVDVAYENARRGEQVRDALGDLRPTEREAVLLRYVSELTVREVGEACGIEEAAARKRIGRALVRLRERVIERETSTAKAKAGRT